VGQDSIEYRGAWWNKSIDGTTILKWEGEQWQPWHQGDSGEAPPRLIYETRQASQHASGVPPPPTQKRKRSPGKVLLGILGVLILLVVIGSLGSDDTSDKPGNVEVVANEEPENEAAAAGEEPTPNSETEPDNSSTGSPSEQPPGTVPDVVGRQLNLAEREVKKAGLRFKAVGGGLFGILDPRAWRVCDQQPRAGVKTSERVRLVAARNCRNFAVEDEFGRMPDVVGMNLQAAQNKLQALKFFNLHSFDATGQGRLQVLDRGWVVVEQTPAAGTSVGSGRYIRLGVKRTAE